MSMIPKDEVAQAAKVLNRATGDIIRGHSLYRKRFRILKDLLQQGRHDSIAWQLVDILFSADEDPVFLSTNMAELLVDHVYTTGNVSIHEILVVTDIVLDMELNEILAEILQRLKAAMETPLYVSERARMKAASIEVESFMYGPSAWSLDGLTNDYFHATDSDNEYSDVESNDETISIDGHHIGCLRGNAANPDVILLLPTIPTVSECHIYKDHDTKHVFVKLPCAHTFHQKCVRRWLQSSNSCPLCKNELPRESTVPIASTFEALDLPKHLPLGKVIRLQVVKNSLPNPESNESGYKDEPKVYFVDRKGIVLSSEKKKTRTGKSRANLAKNGSLPEFLSKLEFGSSVTARVMLDDHYLPTIGPTTFKRNFEDQESPMQVLGFMCMGKGQYAKSTPRHHVESMAGSLEPNVTYV